LSRAVALSSVVGADRDERRPRNGNSGTGTRYPLGQVPDGYGDDFLSAGGTRTRLESRRVRNGYFFPPADNPTGIRYFTTVIIIGCEHIKIYLFCYINYGDC
jgi:hypothetical protein